ncbi:hypothetical protein F53441_1593 [Fusarium austroafricanum]|uniref:BZIP domain-containing protein n=1 Tax=Fusarium austroafricanum TaxID=2364996 RepID=A0A8H4KU64_9HYPO|nr:hypothetical protein F53441_1593 [Fusarium austroafricanum]
MSDTTKVKKGKVPAKRNSEARREQNRLSSRTYREKRKQKLALLNELLEPSNVPSIAKNVQINAVPEQSGSTDLLTLPLQDQSLSGTAPPSDPITVMDPNSWQNLAQVPMAIAFPHPVFPNSLPLANIGDPFGLGTQDSWGQNMPGFSQQPIRLLDGSAPDDANHMSIEECVEDSPDSGHGSSQVSSSDDDGALNNVLSGVENLNIEQKRSLLRHLQQDTRVSTSSRPSRQTWQQTPGQIKAIQFAKALFKTAYARPSLFPTQYTMEPGIFGAIFANCYALGMPGVDEMLHDEGCSVFSVTPDEGHHPSQLSLVKSRFLDLSSDLQPTENQLTFGHHPYIDAIPFKTFRENLITILDRDPTTIDEGVLCHDILSGGFTCWGAAQNSNGMGAGVPWDSHSWEPSVWFLVKYRGLVGDWDGELWKSARWWHNVRGERIQVSQASKVVDNTFEQSLRR